MPLEEQIASVRKEIKPDGYDMSAGELMNLYRSGELVINPAYQRLFRWQPIQKTRFIESLLLGIPIPPFFVFQSDKGIWELIDGLQRLSTLLEFTGAMDRLPIPEGEDVDESDDEDLAEQQDQGPATLLGTNFLPDLEAKAWSSSEDGSVQGIGTTAQLLIRRSRLRVEILKQEGDATIKYEVFQRLNTGGSKLSEQEVRNCTAVMIDPTFFDWITALAKHPAFVSATQQTKQALKRQAGTELAFRLVAFRNFRYAQGLDVHEYLDKAMKALASEKQLNRDQEADVFRRTFDLLERALGASSFKRWNGTAFAGKFLMSLFEVIAVGVAANIDALEALGAPNIDLIRERSQSLWGNQSFLANSGAGVRGTTRLARLLGMGATVFRP